MRDEDETRRTEEAKPQNLKHNHTVYTYEVPTRRTAVVFIHRPKRGRMDRDRRVDERDARTGRHGDRQR